LLAGLDPATPAATIENGTREDEVVRHGTLAGLGALGALRGSGPLLVVVGRTAGLGLTLGPVLCQGALAAATAAADVVAATAAEKEAR
jgi:siroheme synthase